MFSKSPNEGYLKVKKLFTTQFSTPTTSLEYLLFLYTVYVVYYHIKGRETVVCLRNYLINEIVGFFVQLLWKASNCVMIQEKFGPD